MNSALANISSTKNWYAIYTRFRSEKMVAMLLERKGINCYLPLRDVVKRYTRKIRRYQVPLINSYVFVNIDPKQYVRVLETEHVIKFIKPGKDLYPIPEKEIDTLKRIVGEKDVEVSTSSIDLAKGEEVEVIAGSMVGIRGKIIERANKNTFVVDLNHIGFQIQIQIDGKLLSAVKLGG